MYSLEDIQIQDFGQVGEVIITKDDTLFMKVNLPDSCTISEVNESELKLHDLLSCLNNSISSVVKIKLEQFVSNYCAGRLWCSTIKTDDR